MNNQDQSTGATIADSSPAPCYEPFEGADGEWGVEQGGSVVYDSCCGFDRATAELMAEIMNGGQGLDAWCESEDENADLLRDRLIERGWVDPLAHNTEVTDAKRSVD